tara:strand:- start:223 stop:666 length:444 start_codon:yes stop_codon:yes gene_type:complete
MEVNCIVCNKKFKTHHPKYLCCSAQCGKTHKINTRYKRESGNWLLYFRHLLSKKKTNVSPNDLIKILDKQKGKCALSGDKLTCKKVRGLYVKTNASIDRIIAGGEYNVDNIQLVCRAINSFRHNLTVKDFIKWCKKVAKNGVQKQRR